MDLEPGFEPKKPGLGQRRNLRSVRKVQDQNAGSFAAVIHEVSSFGLLRPKDLLHLGPHGAVSHRGVESIDGKTDEHHYAHGTLLPPAWRRRTSFEFLTPWPWGEAEVTPSGGPRQVK